MSLGAWLEGAIATAEAPFIAAFLIGLLASVGPCPLATNVTALGYMARQFSDRRAVAISAVSYVLGRTVAYGLVGLVILAAGAQVAAIARPLQDIGEIVLGPVLILVGLVLLDVIRPELELGGGVMTRLRSRIPNRPGSGAFLLGFLFALAFCPYSAALYFGVLIPLALGASGGLTLPLVFGVGTGVPVLVLGLPLALGLGWAATGFRVATRLERLVRQAVGYLFVAAGAYLIVRFLWTMSW